MAALLTEAAKRAAEGRHAAALPRPGPGDGRPGRAGADHACARRSAASPAAPTPGSCWARPRSALDRGRVTPEARAAFARAAALDPSAPEPAYFLARARIAERRRRRAAWPPGAPCWAGCRRTRRSGRCSPRRSPRSSATGRLAGRPAQPPRRPRPRRAARLHPGHGRPAGGAAEARPDDPAGWARLVRSYGVLGQEDRRTRRHRRGPPAFRRHGPSCSQAILAGDEAAAAEDHAVIGGNATRP